MDKVIKYSNGLRLVVENIPTMRSVATGIWVGAGSSRETSEMNGISHFTEHMMFKGTPTYTAYEIAKAFEDVGAMVNAFTGKECTCYYVKSVDEFSETCFKLLCDIALNSTFAEEELAKERKVIVEEINMEEDSPEDICYDLLGASLYPNSALGQTILGSIDNVNRFNGDDIRRYMSQVYTPDNIVIAIAGNMTLEQADKLTRKYLLPYMNNNVCAIAPCKKIEVKTNLVTRIKDFEQSNIALSYPSIIFNDAKSSTQAALNMLLGGGMSSRLFQHIREQLGLAYSVYSTPSAYANNGNFNILLNITPANTEKALVTARKEIDKLLEKGIDAEEFARAKAQLKAANVFAQENIQTIMSVIGKLMLVANQEYDMDRKISEIDAVSIDDVNNFAQKLFTNTQVCAAYVGKKVDADILSIIKPR